MLNWLTLLADADTAQGPPGWSYLFYLLPVLLVLMLFRSGAKQKRDLQKALAALKKNDKVVTAGGILGVVVAIKDNEDEVTLKVDDTSNTRIRVLRSSIVRITSGESTVGETKTS